MRHGMVLLLIISIGRFGSADVISGLQAQSLVCLNSGRVGVTHCRGFVEGYSQPVHMFVPLTLGRHPALLYYFHGFWLDGGTNPFAGDRGDFAASLAESKADVIAVVPESRGQNADFRRQLGTAAQVDAFVLRTEDLLYHAGVTLDSGTPKLLAGHSGAYVTLAQIGEGLEAREIPSLANVVGFGLLDCGYGYRPGLNKVLRAMCARRSSATHFQAYNPADGANEKLLTNERLYQEARRDCPKANIIYLQDPALVHMEFPRHFLGQFLSAALGRDDRVARLLQPAGTRAPASLTRAVTRTCP